MTMKVLDKGEVSLVQHMGSDHMVVASARISNGAAMPEWRGAPDERLIRFLADNDHLTPFEHNGFTFYIKAPIFVMREWMRHRTFSYNEQSARYMKLEPDFYFPDAPRVSHPGNKQSSIAVEDDNLQMDMHMLLSHGYEEAWNAYERMLGQGIAREIARSVLPVGTYTQAFATGNFRNWMHFVNLRGSKDAQYEIQVYADAILAMIGEKMPLSVEAFRRKFK